jgi:hypothetical protein
VHLTDHRGRRRTSQAGGPSRLRNPAPAIRAQLATLLIITSRCLALSCLLGMIMMWNAVAPL